MTWQSRRMWWVGTLVISASLGVGARSDLRPWSGAGAVWAAESPIWELQPYRVHVLLCADESPLWTNTRLAALTRDMQRRGVAEFGRRWQMTVEVATADVRRAMLRTDNTTGPYLPAIAGGQDGIDKQVLIALHAAAGEPTVETCAYDAASHGWHRGPQRAMGPWSHLNYAVFESLADAVTPLAVVKTSVDERVVLRLRGGLLPIRNPRRPLAEAGSIFQLAALDAAPAGDAPLPAAYLVVEKVEGHLLTCRGIGSLPSLSGDDAAERWIAIGVRSLGPATEFTLTMPGPAPGTPLAGCDVWLSDMRDAPGTCLGRTDERGRIAATATNSVRWLQVRLGAVVLEQFPVVPGWRARQPVTTHLSTATLATAAALNDCQSELTELTALCNVYRARCKSRERAGRAAEAQTLREEGQQVIQQRVAELRQQISERRQRVAHQFADQSGDVESLWEALSHTLEESLKSMQLDTTGEERNHK